MPADASQLPSLNDTLRPVFYGYTAGAILFGVTLIQAYGFYTTYFFTETWVRKAIIAIVCGLDTLDLIFGVQLVYAIILQRVGGVQGINDHVLVNLKGLGISQTILILFVQGYYLTVIYKFSRIRFVSLWYRRIIQVFVGLIAVYALVVAGIFVRHLLEIKQIVSFTTGMDYIVYLGFGSTALIDCLIAAAMCLILHKNRSDLESGTSTVVELLSQYFVGTGLLTSFAAILAIILYVAKPGTLIYLGLEFSVTRLYANSVLVLFNARTRLRDTVNRTVELPFSTESPLYCKEPDSVSARRRRFPHKHKHQDSLLISPETTATYEDPFQSPEDPVDPRYTEFEIRLPLNQRKDGMLRGHTV